MQFVHGHPQSQFLEPVLVKFPCSQTTRPCLITQNDEMKYHKLTFSLPLWNAYYYYYFASLCVCVNKRLFKNNKTKLNNKLGLLCPIFLSYENGIGSKQEDGRRPIPTTNPYTLGMGLWFTPMSSVHGGRSVWSEKYLFLRD